MLSLLLLSACTVVDAPDSIEELMVFGFAHHADADAFLTATCSDLRPLAHAHRTELAEGLRIADLDDEDLATAGIDAEIELGIVGIAGQVGMVSALDDVARAWSHPHMDEVLSTTTAFEVREEHGDRECFLARECETYGYEGWRRNQLGLLGTSEQEFTRGFRWVELDDGTTALTTRQLAPEGSEMSSHLVRIDAHYGLSVFYDDGGTTRLDAFWVDAEAVGIEVPDYFALDMAVKQMVETAAEVDAFVAAEAR